MIPPRTTPPSPPLAASSTSSTFPQASQRPPPQAPTRSPAVSRQPQLPRAAPSLQSASLPPSPSAQARPDRSSTHNTTRPRSRSSTAASPSSPSKSPSPIPSTTPTRAPMSHRSPPALPTAQARPASALAARAALASALVLRVLVTVSSSTAEAPAADTPMILQTALPRTSTCTRRRQPAVRVLSSALNFSIYWIPLHLIGTCSLFAGPIKPSFCAYYDYDYFFFSSLMIRSSNTAAIRHPLIGDDHLIYCCWYGNWDRVFTLGKDFYEAFFLRHDQLKRHHYCQMSICFNARSCRTESTNSHGPCAENTFTCLLLCLKCDVMVNKADK